MASQDDVSSVDLSEGQMRDLEEMLKAHAPDDVEGEKEAEKEDEDEDEDNEDDTSSPVPSKSSARTPREKKESDTSILRSTCGPYIASVGIDRLTGPLTKVYKKDLKIVVPNQHVRTFPLATKETPTSVLKAGKSRISAATLAKYADHMYENLIYVVIKKDSRTIRKYAYSTAPKGSSQKEIAKPEHLVFLDPRYAKPFHSPSFNPAEHYDDAQVDSGLQTFVTNDGTVFQFPAYDADYVAWHALQAGRTNLKKGEVQATPKPAEPVKVLCETGTQLRQAGARTVLMEMEKYHEKGAHPPVVKSNDPALFSALYSTLASRMKPLQSVEKDGINAFPYDFAIDHAAAMDLFNYMGNREIDLPSLLATETLIKLIVFNGNCVRGLAEPFARFIHEHDAVLNEATVHQLLEKFKSDDTAQYEAVRYQTNYYFAADFPSILIAVKSELCVKALPLFAFATVLRKLGKMTLCTAPQNGSPLTSALTGRQIARGSRFWLLQGIMSPHFTGGKPGVEIIATVEEHLDTTDVAFRDSV